MEGWVLWLIAAVAAAVGEIATMGFFLAPFAAGAAVAMVIELAGGGFVPALIAFTAVTGGTFAFLRPVARRHMRQPPSTRTGTAALIGRSAIVLERIANHEGVGTVRLEGEVWTARAYDDDQIIEAGKKVDVVEIRGALAMVSE